MAHVVNFSFPSLEYVCEIRQIPEFTIVVMINLFFFILSVGLYTFSFQSLTKGVEVSNPVLQCVVTVRLLAHCLQVNQIILLRHHIF